MLAPPNLAVWLALPPTQKNLTRQVSHLNMKVFSLYRLVLIRVENMSIDHAPNPIFLLRTEGLDHDEHIHHPHHPHHNCSGQHYTFSFEIFPDAHDSDYFAEHAVRVRKFEIWIFQPLGDHLTLRRLGQLCDPVFSWTTFF